MTLPSLIFRFRHQTRNAILWMVVLSGAISKYIRITFLKYIARYKRIDLAWRLFHIFILSGVITMFMCCLILFVLDPKFKL